MDTRSLVEVAKSEELEEVAFVRTYETVLHVAPLCYGTYSERCDKLKPACCWKAKCVAGVPLEVRKVKKGLYERKAIC